MLWMLLTPLASDTAPTKDKAESTGFKANYGPNPISIAWNYHRANGLQILSLCSYCTGAILSFQLSKLICYTALLDGIYGFADTLAGYE